MRRRPDKNTLADLLRGQAVSGVYQDYVEPLILEWADLNPKPSIASLNERCRFPWTVWNAVVLTDFYPKSSKTDHIEELRRLAGEDHPAIQALVEFYIARKRSSFAEFRYMFGICEFYQDGNGEFRCRAEATLPPGIHVDLQMAVN